MPARPPSSPTPPTPCAPSARPGFTVLEVLVALTVLSISTAGAAFLMTSAFGTYRHQDRSLETRRIVHDSIETLTGTPYDALKQRIERARYAQDQPAPGTGPTEDWVTDGQGQAVSRYKLNPPTAKDGDWLPEPDPAARPHDPAHPAIRTSTPDPNQLSATLSLQYWDAQFDQPTQRDSGLIRASYTLSGRERTEHAVKYLTR